MFLSIGELVGQAKAYPSIAKLMIAVEMEMSNCSRSHIIEIMEKSLSVMEQSINKGKESVTSATEITGGDAKKLDDHSNKAGFLSGETVSKAIRNAVAVNGVNAEMGLICATPTTRSAGVISGVLVTVRDRLDLTYEQQLKPLFTIDAFGLVIADNVSIGGAEGGCQAEVSSTSAIAAAALVCAENGIPHQAAQAVAITLKSMMGLTCNPVVDLIEVPCVKRNALGSSQALTSADMALAGTKSAIPPDEVVATTYQVRRRMLSIFKETAESGLVVTPTTR